MTVIRARKSCPYGYKSRITKMVISKKLKKRKKKKKHKINIHMFIMNIIKNLNNFINHQAAHNK